MQPGLVHCRERERERECARPEAWGVFHSSFNLPLHHHHPFVSLSLSLRPHTGTKLRDATGAQWALSRDLTLILEPPTPADVDRIREWC